MAALEGTVDAFINNAGIFEELSIEESDEKWLAAWDSTMRINLTSSASLSRLAVRHFMLRGSGGRKINITSRAPHRGDGPDYWHYASSKAGLIALTKTIARGYGREGILSFAVSPGLTKTDIVRPQLDSSEARNFVAEIPLGKVAEPEEIAEATAFLVLKAPTSMTGATVDLNGASYVR